MPLIGLMLFACTLSEEAFPERFARDTCRGLHDCDLPAFESFVACEAEMTEVVEASMDCHSFHCTYDPHAAFMCAQNASQTACGNGNGWCERVWVDCDDNVDECY